MPADLLTQEKLETMHKDLKRAFDRAKRFSETYAGTEKEVGLLAAMGSTAQALLTLDQILKDAEKGQSFAGIKRKDSKLG